MRFANWYFLLLFIVIPLLHRWWVTRNRPPSVQYSLPIPNGVSSKNPLKILLGIKYLGLALLIIALARPQHSYQQQERKSSGIDIMLLLDISPSMEIEDLGERSRLDIAKDTIESFVKGRKDDRIGLIVFSGEPLTLAPLTLDTGLLLRSLRQATTGRLKEGTGIGDGLALTVGQLRTSKAKSRVIVLLTDGDNNVGQVDPATAGELAAGYGLKVYTIAIGREGKVKMPIRRQNLFGKVVTSYQWLDNALNPELLQFIAKTTNGKFYRVTDENTLDSVFKEIDQLEKSDVKTQEKVKYDELFQWPLKLSLLVFFIEQLLSRVWWRFLP